MSRRRAFVFLLVIATLVTTLVGVRAASAQVVPVDVMISEIMFDAESDLDTDEFLEIWNAGGSAVDVGGWCLTGVTFCFPTGASITANGFAVLSPDRARTQALYGIVPQGTYAGSLRNSGETVALTTAAGAVVHSFSYLDVHPWPVLPDGQGPSLELISRRADRASPWNWAASQAVDGHSAGAVNSVDRPGTPPTIGTVTETTRRPAAGQPVTVTAAISGHTGAPVLAYRTNMGPFTPIPMVNVGAGNWTVTMPGQPAGTLLEYRITTAGVFPHSYPRLDDSWPTIGIWYPRTVSAGIPVFEWFIDPVDYTEMTTTFRYDETGVTFPASLVFDGEVITGATVRVRGNSSRNAAKVSFKWELPQNHDLLTAGRLVEPIDEFAMQADYSDRTYARSMLAFSVYEAAGLPRPQRFAMHVERNGSFEGLYGMMETYDKNWRERYGFEDDGRFYEAEDGAFDPSRRIEVRWSQKSGPEDGLATIAAMAAAVTQTDAAAREAYIRANFDIPQVIEYAAATAINQHIDSSSKNYNVFLANATGRWTVIPWDLDHTWGNLCSCGVTSTFVTPAEPGDKQNAMMTAVLAVPEFRQMYFRRLRTLADQIFAPGLLTGRYDALLAGTGPTAVADKAKWGQCCTVSHDRRRIIESFDSRRILFATDPRIPPAQTPTRPIVISEILTSATGGTAEFVELYNPSATEAVDLSGWSLNGSVTATLQPGSVIPAGRSVVLVADDPAFRSRFGGNAFVIDRFTGSLPAMGQLTLARADGSVADDISYGGAGWPMPTGSQSLTVNYIFGDNAPATNWRARAASPSSIAGILVCRRSTVGNDVTLRFSGVRGTSEVLRRAPDTFVATTTGQTTYTAVGGATTTYFVRVRGTGYPGTGADIACS